MRSYETNEKCVSRPIKTTNFGNCLTYDLSYSYCKIFVELSRHRQMSNEKIEELLQMQPKILTHTRM